ncbi:MAG: glutaredoxin family protein [Porticoccaceae bacterium]|nr:glutaredoxin family protein [Porticoccaceae bacterium]
MSESHQLILYTGTLCHLCKDAKNILYGVLPENIHFIESNIDDDPRNKSAYGMRIPVFVVKSSTGEIAAEKDWPFTPGQIRKILGDYCLNGD